MNAGPLPEHLRRVHMVGIGGAGMSGIARILLDRGAQVSGSDAKESRGVLALRARGALVNIGHDGDALDLLPGGPTVVVTTHAAIPKTNPELVEANRRGIPVLLRPVVLADLMAGYRTLMVTGTHGKTSTTSMLIVALQHCGYDPSFAVGGELNEAGTNAHHGSGDVFVAEADESDGSLLQYRPNLIVVTNIEADHLDHFGSAEAYSAVFDEFAETLGSEGVLVVCLDDPGAAALARRAHDRGIQVRGYGSAGQAEAGGVPVAGQLRDWQFKDTGATAQIQLAGESAPRTMRLSVPGRHMALNALAAVVAAPRSGRPSTMSWTGWPDSRACAADSNWSGRWSRCGFSTTMRTIPPRCARCCRPFPVLWLSRALAVRWLSSSPIYIPAQRLSLKNSPTR